MTLQSNLVCALVLTLSIVAILCCHGISAQTINPVQTFATGARRVVVDGDYLITAHVDVQVWTNNIDTGTKIMDITTGYTEPISVMTAIGGFLYAATSNGPRSIRKWNFITGIEIWRAPDVGNSHDDTLTGMAVSGTGMYTSSADGTIKLWNLNNGGFVNMVQGATGPSGFFAPIRNLIFDGATNQLFAGFGSYKASDGVGRATFVPTGDFEGIGTSDTISSWEASTGVTLLKASSRGLVAPSGLYTLWLKIYAGSLTTDFLKQTLPFVPGHSYQLRFWYARLANDVFPSSVAFSVCGKNIALGLTLANDGKFYRGSSVVFQATGKMCVVELTASGCSGPSACSILIDFMELVLVQRYSNFENMEITPLVNGGFEGITTTLSSTPYTGTFGAWTKSGGSGTVAIALVGSSIAFNLPAAGGSYALWMVAAAGDDTTVSQTVTLEPGSAYIVRWHYAMCQTQGGSTTNLDSSTLNVLLCGTVVANNYLAPSLLFEEVSSAMFTPIGTTTMACSLTFTILRGASTLRSLLIDEVELVRVRTPNLVPLGNFEGITTTSTSWDVGTTGIWRSSVSAPARAAIVRLPSTECSNVRSIASPYALWFQGSEFKGPPSSVYVAINTFETGATYVVRWLFARRQQGPTIFDASSLSVYVFGSVVASGRRPYSTTFIAQQSFEFIASGTTTTLTLEIAIEVGVTHLLIDDVEVVKVKSAPAAAGVPPLVKQYTTSVNLLTFIRDHIVPASTLPAGAAVDFDVLIIDSNKLFTGMSLSLAGTECYVFVYVVGGAYDRPYKAPCNGGSVRSMAISRGQLFVGHVGGVAQMRLADGSVARAISWITGNVPVLDMAASNQYLVAGGSDLQALKWRMGELAPVTTTSTTTTSTSTTSTKTTTTTTSTTTSSTKTTTTTTTTKTTTTTTSTTTSSTKTTTRTSSTSTTTSTSSTTTSTSSTTTSTSSTTTSATTTLVATITIRNPGNDVPLTITEWIFIASGASAGIFMALGIFLFVRRRRHSNKRLADYEMAKSNEALRRSEMELREVIPAVSIMQTASTTTSHNSLYGTPKSSLKSASPRETVAMWAGIESQGKPPLTLREIRGAPPVPTKPPQLYTKSTIVQSNGTSPNGYASRTLYIDGSLQSESSRATMPSLDPTGVFFRSPPAKTIYGGQMTVHEQRVTMLSHVVGEYQKKRSLDPTLRDGNRTATKLTRRGDVTNTTQQRTLVDQGDHGLEIPGFLSLDEGSDYQMESPFASGGGGALFRGRMLDPTLRGIKIVVKKIVGTSLAAFRQEVAIMWLFKANENMVKLIGFNEMLMAIVMPEYKMGSLEQFIATFAYSSGIARSLALDISNGIMAMHERGIVHQDIKCDNILLENHPRKHIQAVLTDFGISNVVEDRALTVKAFEVKNVRGLTVRYAAPEAIVRFRTKLRIQVTPRVAKAGDVYSLAIVVHALLVNKGSI